MCSCHTHAMLQLSHTPPSHPHPPPPPHTHTHTTPHSLTDGLDVPNGTRHTPHVMTLFDRKVDLAKFAADTPLYVMCREWMSNNPDNTHTTRLTPSQDHSSTSQHLPPPTPLPMDKDGQEIRIDIPKPHPPISKSRDEMDKQIAEVRDCEHRLVHRTQNVYLL